MQFNLSIQREIFQDTVLTVTYVGNNGRHEWARRDYNPVIPFVNANGQLQFATSVNGSPVANPRGNPGFTYLNLQNSEGNSSYNALQVNLVHRFAHNFQAQAAYTWSHSIDTDSGSQGLELGSTAENPYNVAWDRGDSQYDVRQNLRLNGVYTLPFNQNRFVSGWGVSGIVSVQTGLHFSVLNGFDSANFGTATERPYLNPGFTASSIITGNPNQWFNPAAFTLPPLGVLGNLGRDVFTGPGIFDADVSFTKDTKIPEISEQFSLQFRAELFNIFNHPNFGLPATGAFTGSGAVNASAGLITTTTTASRQIQFSLRVRF
jgi:hypothetical protein